MSETGLFYAYAKYIRDDVTYRYIITFANRSTADGWWRAVSGSVASGYQRFAQVQRVTPQFYTHDVVYANIADSLTDPKVANSFIGLVFFTLLNDRDGRIQSIAPVLNYTDFKSGDGFFVRSVLSPDTYWYYDTTNGENVIRASTQRRTKFIVRLDDTTKPAGTIMIGTDDIAIIIPSATGTSTSFVSVDTGSGYLRSSAQEYRFKFSDFVSGTFLVGIGQDTDGFGPVVVSSASGSGERWQIVN